MKAWNIIGWSYDAAIHCPACAEAARMSKNGAVDTEGNEPHPIFASDEIDTPQYCDDCQVEIE